MTSADVLGVLAEATVALSAAIGVVLLLRRPLRRWFGATAGYAAWAMVPVALVAVSLPSRTVPVVAVAASEGLLHVGTATLTTASVLGSAGPGLVAAWLCGVIVMAMRLGLQQSGFVRSLGVLRHRADGALQADAVAGLPAVVGLLHPRTVLPADFETRYTGAQQRLLRAHEREHVVRGDLWANAFAGMLRCLSWFNPLVHLAARAFRHDQELACDQRVLAAHPGARRAYGEAMFNTQLAAQPLPLGCHWGFGHPLKERIEMLKQPLPSRRRWITGTTLAGALASFAGVAAWAAQPPVASGSAVAGPAAAAYVAGAAPVDSDLRSRSLQPPKYPAEAAAQKISGRVVLLIDIDAKGKPTAIEVETAEPVGVFEAQAVAAAWDWTFDPEIKDGRPVSSRVRVPVDFKMDPPAGAGGSPAPGAMVWSEPAESGGSGTVTGMTCDMVHVDADNDPACGNRRIADARP